MNKYIIYTDGGSRGNPGPAAYGAVIKTAEGEVTDEVNGYIGINTNNFAEYTAVVKALEKLASTREGADVEVFMDSQVVKRQLTGEYRIVNPILLTLYKQIKIFEKKFSSIKYTHVRREFNKEADAQVNKALDALL